MYGRSSNSATIFDILDPGNVNSVGFFLSEAERGLKICQTALSPDNRYLSFQGGCVDQFPFLPSGIYTWDTTYNPKQGQVIQSVTNASRDLIGTDGSLLPVFAYAPIWVDNEHLLVGSRVSILDAETGFQKDTYRQETRLYNVVTHENRLISPDQLGSWAVNPVKDLWAYVRQPAVTSFSLNADDGNRLWPDVPPSSVEISTFDGQQFTPLIVAPDTYSKL